MLMERFRASGAVLHLAKARSTSPCGRHACGASASGGPQDRAAGREAALVDVLYACVLHFAINDDLTEISESNSER